MDNLEPTDEQWRDIRLKRLAVLRKIRMDHQAAIRKVDSEMRYLEWRIRKMDAARNGA